MEVYINDEVFESISDSISERELTLYLNTNKPVEYLEQLIGVEPVIRIGDAEYTGYKKLLVLAKRFAFAGYSSAVEVVLQNIYDDAAALQEVFGEHVTYDEAKFYRKDIENMATDVPDDKASDHIWAFPNWSGNSISYQVGDRVQYEGLLYKCLQAHVSQVDWTPSSAVSLWTRVDDPGEEWPEWRQPTGAQDAYPKDYKVSFNGKHWKSLVDANVWQPGVYGWEEVTEPNEETPVEPSEPTEEPTAETPAEWEQKTYNIGDRVTFNGKVYESIMDNNVWSPEAYPAGWEEVE